MINRDIFYQVDKLNGYPHGKGIAYELSYKFEGTWNKGMRVKKGYYHVKGNIHSVKFKKGKVFRLLDTSFKASKNFIISIPQLDLINEGDYFREIISLDECFFFVNEEIILFDGHFRKPGKVAIMACPSLNLIGIHNDKFGLYEYQCPYFRLICKSLNKMPLGPCTVIFNNEYRLEGAILGFNFIGPCLISKGVLNLRFTDCLFSPPNEFIFESKELGLKSIIKLNENSQEIISEKDSAYKHLIFEFFNDCLENISNFVMDIQKYYLIIIKECFVL